VDAPAPVISIIIPAHNEEALLGATLEALRAAIAGVDEPHEIVVVDDCSTDHTAEIARAHGARVVRADVHQIAAARNAGARAAAGEIFIFVDADTIVAAPILRAAVGRSAGAQSAEARRPSSSRTRRAGRTARSRWRPGSSARRSGRPAAFSSRGATRSSVSEDSTNATSPAKRSI
jgi:glycosyltransferase involved in cell wall biosynthesis